MYVYIYIYIYIYMYTCIYVQGIIPTNNADLEEALEMGLDWSLREVLMCERIYACYIHTCNAYGNISRLESRRGIHVWRIHACMHTYM
jgi:hypothetical protein